MSFLALKKSIWEMKTTSELCKTPFNNCSSSESFTSSFVLSQAEMHTFLHTAIASLACKILLWNTVNNSFKRLNYKHLYVTFTLKTT